MDLDAAAGLDPATSSSSKPTKPTTILVPPRGGGGGFLFGSGPGLSPGPLTLISSLFPEQGSFSFSQLLAGAMASPKPAAEPDGGLQLQPQLESLSRLFAAPPPSGLMSSPGYLSSSPLQSPFGMSHQQALAHVTAQAALSQSFMQMQAELQQPSSTDAPESLLANRSSSTPNETSTPAKNQSPPEISKAESSEISQSEKRVGNVGGDKPVSDGYNWRKYGQKHVKNSECPRSYYKCTHIDCPVRKKVERSSDGQISEVTYKGQHNHDLPKPNKRGKDSSPSQVRAEADKLNEVTTPVHSESMSFQSVTQQSFGHHTVAKPKDDVLNTATVAYEGNNDDEPVAKRRSLDTGPSMPTSSHKTVTDSKIVLQTRSEVDLLDDGYRWRKYGQKVVKGNSYPRSYYRCTYGGCNVRKHVERASSDPKAVITTYEGKHSHDMPTGRYSQHQPRTQNTVSENPPLNQEVDCGNKEQIRPATLQLQEGQIMA